MFLTKYPTFKTHKTVLMREWKTSIRRIHHRNNFSIVFRDVSITDSIAVHLSKHNEYLHPKNLYLNTFNPEERIEVYLILLQSIEL